MPHRTDNFTGPAVMLLSAAIFGYFGFATAWNQYSALTGEFLLFVALLEWTLKGSALAFAVSGLLAFARPALGSFIFGIVGLVGAVLFLVIAGMDYVDKQHTALHPLLLVVFAAWNGYGSVAGLRGVIGGRGHRAAAD
ncbi:MAG: hypothetical protein ACYS0G_08540 [Planctomycetota bacterium]|jgi:hypothetical protein